jgi:YD repeat-containing protein
MRQFSYTSRGQLRRERRIDGTEVVYTASIEPAGIKITAARTGTPETTATAQYDTAVRPVSRIFEDGTRVVWRRNDTSVAEATITLPGGEQYIVSYAPDGKRSTWRLPRGGQYLAEYDASGRLTALLQGDRQALRQQWHGNGALAAAAYETVAFHPAYRDDGVLTGLLMTAPKPGPQFSQWLEVKYDELGRVEKVADHSGADLRVETCSRSIKTRQHCN